jgi:3',5'-nucleoside bisphosphate phosphatase
MPFVDLHVHTTFSDGRLTPRQALEEAARLELSAVAITDHDVLGGLAEAEAAGRRLGVEVVPGIELTAQWDGRLVHVLGYFVDPRSSPLRVALERARVEMAAHVQSVLEAARVAGDAIDEDALAKYRGRYVSGAALVLGMLEQGILRRSSKARALLLMAAREPRSFTAVEAIEIIHAAGGIASLAHPVKIWRAKPLLDAADLQPLVAVGLDGIEAWQIVQRTGARDHYLRLAAETGLLPTGGSDCHGPRSVGMRLGTQQVPEWVLSEMRERWLARRALPGQT